MTDYLAGQAKNPSKRYKLIACEILFRECAAAMADCDAIVDPEFLPKGLHDLGEKEMSLRIQGVIDALEPGRYDAVLLAYGLCNYGTRGLHAPVPIVLPRAHDCITLLLGSRARYDEYFAANPGTFFKSPGWIERDADPNANQASISSKLGMSHDRADLVDKYGEENADFLMESMGDWLRNYRRLAYIDTGVGPTAKYLKVAGDQAGENGWELERVQGSRRLLEGLLSGDWSREEFLVLNAGERIDASWDERVVCPMEKIIGDKLG